MDNWELRQMEDEDTPTMKIIKGVTTSLVVGTIWGTIVATWHDIPRVEKRIALPGLIRTLKMMGSYGATYAAIGGIYIGVEQAVEKYRMKKDFVNGAVGGIAAGASVFGYKGRTISRAIAGGAGLGLASVVYEVFGGPGPAPGFDSGKEITALTTKKRPNA